MYRSRSYRNGSVVRAATTWMAVTLIAAWLPASTVAAPDAGALDGTGHSRLDWAARYAVSARVGEAETRYHGRLADGAVEFDTGTGRATFDAQGLFFTDTGEDLAWRFAGAGRGGAAFHGEASARPRLEKNRVYYERGVVTEWFANGPFGLQHGFTVAAPPAGEGPLTVAMAVDGGEARIELDAERRMARMIGADGDEFSYGRLEAFDARGRQLVAWLADGGGTLLLKVDDTGAAYPVTIDPFLHTARLAPSDGVAGDAFGHTVAMDGDTIVVGAPNKDGNRGAAYVFVKPDGGWRAARHETVKLVADDGAAGDWFGASVAMDGDTIVVGAPRIPSGRGKAYVFVEPPSGWAGAASPLAPSATLEPEHFDDPCTEAVNFGLSLAIFGDDIAITQKMRLDLYNKGACVWLFSRPDDGGWRDTVGSVSVWTMKQYQGQWDVIDQLAYAVALSDQYLYVGVSSFQTPGMNILGAVLYVKKPARGWSHLHPHRVTGWLGLDSQWFAEQLSFDPYDLRWPNGYMRPTGLAREGLAVDGQYVYAAAEEFPLGSQVLVWETPDRGGRLVHRLVGPWKESLIGPTGSLASTGDTVFGYWNIPRSGNRLSVTVWEKPVDGWAEETDHVPSYHLKELPGHPPYPAEVSTQVAAGDGAVVAGAPLAGAGVAYVFENCHGEAGTMKPAVNTWTMLGVPCDAGPGATVEDVFGDDLDPDFYTRRWVLYRHDPATASYVLMGLDDPVRNGEGYWLLTLDEAEVDWHGERVPADNTSECTAIGGCIEVPVTPPTGLDDGFRLLGHPVERDIPWDEVKVLANGQAYTLAEAQLEGFVSRTFFTWDGDRYQAFDDTTVGMKGALTRWNGIWVQALNAAPADTRLLIPRQPAVAPPPPQ